MSIGYKCQNVSIDILCNDVIVCDGCSNITIGHCCSDVIIKAYAGQGGSVFIKHNSKNITVDGEIGKNIRV